MSHSASTEIASATVHSLGALVSRETWVSRKKLGIRALALSAATCALVATFTLSAVTTSNEAHAQEVVSSTGKGIIGGALLGGEVVMITESLIGVKPTWAYIVGGGLGAVGGGIGGYFIEGGSADGKVPTYLLAGGLALVIPTLVLTLNATRYTPSETAREDKAPTNDIPADAGVRGGSSVGPSPAPANPAPAGGTPASPAPATAPTPGPGPTTRLTPAAAMPSPMSMVSFQQGSLRLGLPLPEVLPVFSMAERRQLNVKQETEFRFPMVHVAF